MDKPEITFGALIAGVKVNQTGDGEVTVVLKVPAVYAEIALSLGLFVGSYWEQVSFAKPSKMDQA